MRSTMQRLLVLVVTAPTALAMLIALTPAVLIGQGGPTDRQKVDPAAAQRGRTVYAAQCINCHGSTAKGGPNGPDLIRSTAVLRDRLGSHIGPAMRAASASHQGALTTAQLVDLSHFLRDRVEAVIRNRTPTAPIDVLIGDPEAGRVYFNGAGRCSTCHSPTGDLAGLRARTSDALTLKQRFLFPSLVRSSKQVEVTVTPASGPPVSGTLVRLDNFTVSLRDAAGDYRSFSRVPGVTLDVRDPLTAHRELLDHYTDEAIHDVVAYLWTIK
jgi:cytochrome c oxidase cbb3-type subunit III